MTRENEPPILNLGRVRDFNEADAIKMIEAFRAKYPAIAAIYRRVGKSPDLALPYKPENAGKISDPKSQSADIYAQFAKDHGL